MPVFRPSSGEITEVQVQDFILKTHIDYLDEHEKNEMKSAGVVDLIDPALEEEENILPEESVPMVDTSSSRTRYVRNSKPVPGSLREKDSSDAPTSTKSTLTPASKPVVTSAHKNLSKVRFRYRGYNFHGLALNTIKTEDPDYSKMISHAIRYPSFFQPFAKLDLLFRNPPEHAKFKEAPHVQLLLGQKSSVTKFHQESLNSHSALVLLSGTKRWFFRFPEEHGKRQAICIFKSLELSYFCTCTCT